jgi:hypothetical protein
MHYSYLAHLSTFWLSVEDEWYKVVTVVLTSAQVLYRKMFVKGDSVARRIFFSRSNQFNQYFLFCADDF